MYFVNEPSRPTFSPMPIIVCKGGQRVEVICLTRQLCGVDTHWFGGHTIACCGTDNCEACNADRAPVWKGYFIGRSEGSGNKGLILVTEGAYESLSFFAQHVDRFLGLRVCITREGRRNNSPMRCACFGRADDVKEFPHDSLVSMVTRIFAANAQKVQDMS